VRNQSLPFALIRRGGPHADLLLKFQYAFSGELLKDLGMPVDQRGLRVILLAVVPYALQVLEEVLVLLVLPHHTELLPAHPQVHRLVLHHLVVVLLAKSYH
jgi:hypothetical protein